MEHVVQTDVEYIKVRCCPKEFPCPQCGRKGRRKTKQPLRRQVRTIAYRKIVFLDIHYAEYRARCDCSRTFRSAPEGVDLRCLYDNKVRQAVLDRLLEDGMNVQKVKAALKRDFLLDLSDGFLYDCIRREAARLDMQQYRQWVLENFRGTLCIDELHLGRYTLLLATDPLQDFPVAFALVDQNDGDHMRRFLQNLADRGLSPEVVVTDGSALYPNLLADIWPEARHQLCLFHVIQDINNCVLDAVKRMRRELSKRGNRGRRRRRGRPSKSQQKRRKRRQKTLKEKAKFVFRHRHLIVKRRANLTEQDQKHLRTMLEYLPALKTLREFVDRLARLFESGQSRHQAFCRRAALVRRADFAAVPELAKAMNMLEPEKFAKMIAFLESPACRQVRTNNHVERANRKLRHYEKVRYKWRRRRTIIRFLLLAIVRWQQQHPHSNRAAPQSRQRESPTPIKHQRPARTAA